MVGAVVSFTCGLACLACSLVPETAPLVQAGGTWGVSGAGRGGEAGGTGGASGSGGAAGCGGVQSLTLEAARDTYIVDPPPNSNHGSKKILEILTYDSTSGHRALVAFDTSNLPGGTQLLKATLKLGVVLNGGATQDIGTHRLQKSWTEDGAGWLRFDGSTKWATSGGDFSPASAQAPVGPSIKAGDTLSWDVTTDVASMLAGSNASDGWLLKPLVDDPLDGEELHLASRESPDPSARPKLELSYLVCP